MFNNYLTKILNQAYEFEKSAKHPLTETFFKNVKAEHKKGMKKRSFASTLIVFVGKCIIDSLWMTFLGEEEELMFYGTGWIIKIGFQFNFQIELSMVFRTIPKNLPKFLFSLSTMSMTWYVFAQYLRSTLIDNISIFEASNGPWQYDGDNKSRSNFS